MKRRETTCSYGLLLMELPVKFGVLAVGIILIVIGLRLELMTVKDVREGPKLRLFT